jgi:hypothetical protein
MDQELPQTWSTAYAVVKTSQGEYLPVALRPPHAYWQRHPKFWPH